VENLRILIVDDHAALMRVLVQTLAMESGIEVVGQAQNGREAVEMAAELEPDVILMDVVMPDLNGIEATRQILERDPEIGIIGFSVHSADFYVRDMLEAGARAYILKDNDIGELLSAIETVYAGGTYLSDELAHIIRKPERMTS
jgi:DNA-binding NarL/FixJ family response regulator